jgi:hypothetical protein
VSIRFVNVSLINTLKYFQILFRIRGASGLQRVANLTSAL